MVADTHLYDILSVDTSAGVDEISRAYKKLALKYHPDKNRHDPQLTEHFKELTRAYEVLKDTKARSVYDHYGESGLDGTAAAKQQASHGCVFTSPAGFGPNIFSQMFSNLNDMFKANDMNDFAFVDMTLDAYGSAAASKGSAMRQGASIRHMYDVSLEDLYFGKVAKLQLPRISKCKHCKGRGGSDPQLCASCQGSGRVTVTTTNQFYSSQEVSLCRMCEGSGTVFDDGNMCTHCHGGFVREKKLLRINILPGSKGGDKIVLKGQADEGHNIIPGDVVIQLREIPHPDIVRRNNDLYLEHPIDLKTALLGGTVNIVSFLRPLKLFVNVHGHPTINPPANSAQTASITQKVQAGEVVGTITPGTPKVVCGLGMPINCSSGGTNVQQGDVEEGLSLALFDLSRFERGNLFIKFNVQVPEAAQFTPEALQTLQHILPSETPHEAPEDASVLQAHLSNLPQYETAASTAHAGTKRQRSGP